MNKNNSRKSKSYIFKALLIFFLFAGISLLGIQYKKINQLNNVFKIGLDQDNVNLDKVCEDYIQNYEVIEDDKDGKSKIALTAPDFENIFYQIQKSGGELNSQHIKKIIRENDSVQKEYILILDSVSEEKIKEALIDQVIYEFATAALKQTDVPEGIVN